MIDDLLDHGHDLLLVLDPAHLTIEGDELGHVTVGIGVLRTECGSDLEYPVQSGGHEDLLVELRGLCQVCVLLEVLDLEELRSALGTCGTDLGGVNLCESVLADCLLDELHHHGLELEDGLDLGLPDVHEPVVETGVEFGTDLVDDSEREGDGSLGLEDE